jgi:uncharacterized protein with HEPN domain
MTQHAVVMDIVRLKTALHIGKKMEYLIQQGRHREQDSDLFRRVLGSALEILTEHTRHIPIGIRIKYPRMSWAELQDMPHYSLKQLIDLDDDIFWSTVYKYLPSLIQAGDVIVAHWDKG